MGRTAVLAPKRESAGLERDGGQVPDRRYIGVIAAGTSRVTPCRTKTIENFLASSSTGNCRGPAGLASLPAGSFRQNERVPGRNAPVFAFSRGGSRHQHRGCHRLRNALRMPSSAGRAKVGYQPCACAFPDGGNSGSEGGFVLEGAGDSHHRAIRRQQPEPEKRFWINKCFELSGHNESFRSAGRVLPVGPLGGVVGAQLTGHMAGPVPRLWSNIR